jgi:uncharacterized SAM-binding protein YcdF (DUF218 family)
VIRRAFALIFIVWLLGFTGFALFLPQPLAEAKTDAVVVPTGGGGRIARGLEVLREGQARHLLVTGVDPEVRGSEFAAEYEVSRAEMLCCVTLGMNAADTRGNALETKQWVEENDISSLRLVTTDWHMRRAALDLSRELPGGVDVIRDAVRSQPRFSTLFLEYNKYLIDLFFGRWVDG